MWVGDEVASGRLTWSAQIIKKLINTYPEHKKVDQVLAPIGDENLGFEEATVAAESCSDEDQDDAAEDVHSEDPASDEEVGQRAQMKLR